MAWATRTSSMQLPLRQWNCYYYQWSAANAPAPPQEGVTAAHHPAPRAGKIKYTDSDSLLTNTSGKVTTGIPWSLKFAIQKKKKNSPVTVVGRLRQRSAAPSPRAEPRS